MTASDWRKVLKQIENKPEKAQKFLKHNKPKERTTGIAKNKCERCGRFGSAYKIIRLKSVQALFQRNSGGNRI